MYVGGVGAADVGMGANVKRRGKGPPRRFTNLGAGAVRDGRGLCRRAEGEKRIGGVSREIHQRGSTIGEG